MDNSDNRKRALIEALEKYNGIVSSACRATDIARSTFYQWLNTDEEFKTQVEEIQEVAIDNVESKLFEKINGIKVAKKNADNPEEDIYEVPPSDTAIIFYLKTKAKKRGYVEKVETGFTDKDGNDREGVIIFKIPDNGRDSTSEGLPNEVSQ